MLIDKFLDLVNRGFDVSFNYNDVFYTISLISDDKNGKKFGIGSDNGFTADFESLESIPSFILGDKQINDIIAELKEEDIYY